MSGSTGSVGGRPSTTRWPSQPAIVDHLLLADASPSQLQAVLSMPSNLLAHHVKVLEVARVVRRTRSEADRRRTYLHVDHATLESTMPSPARQAHRMVFVCTHNSRAANSAAAIWTRNSPIPAASAGTHPVDQVHPGALAAARRRKLRIETRTPRHLSDVLAPDDLIIAVCDNAHEELPAELDRMHWSIPDPVRAAVPDAFERAADQLTERINRLVPRLQPL